MYSKKKEQGERVFQIIYNKIKSAAGLKRHKEKSVRGERNRHFPFLSGGQKRSRNSRKPCGVRTIPTLETTRGPNKRGQGSENRT